jgi:hypothetical protein
MMMRVQARVLLGRRVDGDRNGARVADVVMAIVRLATGHHIRQKGSERE